MNQNTLNLIVMLTHNDKTVINAQEVFEQCKDSKAELWGMKEEGLPVEQMKELCQYMKDCGKTVFLEVVAYTEEEGLKGAKLGVECNCDIIMGTIFTDAINDYCKEQNIKYMPFVGTVTERPSILSGSIQGMIAEANSYIEKGAYGVDLLGYRYTGDARALNEQLIKEVNGPVCLAGGINSYQRLDEVKIANPETFTIGSAFFDNCFEGTFAEQIDKVCDYMGEENGNA